MCHRLAVLRVRIIGTIYIRFPQVRWCIFFNRNRDNGTSCRQQKSKLRGEKYMENNQIKNLVRLVTEKLPVKFSDTGL